MSVMHLPFSFFLIHTLPNKMMWPGMHEAELSPLAYSCGNDRRSDLTCPMSILATETDRYFGGLVTYGSD